jgi:hypothetical protein
MSLSTMSFDYEAVGSEILRSGFMMEHMHSRASRMKDYAEAIAPVYKGANDPHRGRYKESFNADEVTDHGGWHADRACAYLTNTSPEAFYVEYGTSSQRAHGTLRQAMVSGALD